MMVIIKKVLLLSVVAGLICILAGCPVSPGEYGRQTVEMNEYFEWNQFSKTMKMKNEQGNYIWTRPNQLTQFTISITASHVISLSGDIQDTEDDDVRIWVIPKNGHDGEHGPAIHFFPVLLNHTGNKIYTGSFQGTVPELIDSGGQMSPAIWHIRIDKKGDTNFQLTIQVHVKVSYIPFEWE